METLRNFIRKNLELYPEWREYNDVVINFISNYSRNRPDMSIEGCKSLIEGISKLIYFNLDKNNIKYSKWKDFSFHKKFNQAVRKLKIDGYEEVFTKEIFNIVLNLGRVRNERCDVSHGQSYPKKNYSDEYFAKLIILWVEGLSYFLLSRYIYLKSKEELIEKIYSDEQFEEFDEYLNGLNPDLDISYSKALMQQDYTDYINRMKEYFSEVEENE